MREILKTEKKNEGNDENRIERNVTRKKMRREKIG